LIITGGCSKASNCPLSFTDTPAVAAEAKEKNAMITDKISAVRIKPVFFIKTFLLYAFILAFFSNFAVDF
jgi:hypothetical protein